MSSRKTNILDYRTFESLAQLIENGKVKKIITMAGAGISTSAGIPDFRSPGSGLYDNLTKYDLPRPEAIFDVVFFMDNPRPFFNLAKELLPGSFKPTPCHYFINLLHNKGLLLRHYTQNIDGLEEQSGLPEDKFVEAHGAFRTSKCLTPHCNRYPLEWMKEQIFANKVPLCTACGNYVKPDIVFFGEGLPGKFYQKSSIDFPQCDLLIILGTSLVVQPFASLAGKVPKSCPRLLINKEDVAIERRTFGDPRNVRDVAWLGTCDDGCFALADALGWKDELQQLIEEGHASKISLDGHHFPLQVKDKVEREIQEEKTD